jgi:hypothetical protein
MILTPNGLAALFGRLTDPTERETYASLISYVGSLPPGDELFRLTELQGLPSLIGMRIPDALMQFLAELREQTNAAAENHAKMDSRLVKLPSEIAAGVGPTEIATRLAMKTTAARARTFFVGGI